MKTTIFFNNKNHEIDLSLPRDISIPLRATNDNPKAWYVDAPKIAPVETDHWIGKVSEGGSVNFNDIHFNPHGHGTHTECLGHITKEAHSINKALNRYFFFAELITVAPEKDGDDYVISRKQLQYLLGQKKREAVIIRTMPNFSDKLNRQYSNTNPPYLMEEAAAFIKDRNIQHLLIDLPSVDKEKDDGKLLAHRAFWDMGGQMRHNATITELIYVPNDIIDGTYFLNIQVAPFENDAAPSRPVLYEIIK
ncbi:cyclase family protein [Sungkyunkwania multivorans]|uniref:Cyclase family protein n=1 Tax=Sungkyunkwania multivorans TaxID=1173618 RepID=A0ABW3D1B5_9FLAO